LKGNIFGVAFLEVERRADGRIADVSPHLEAKSRAIILWHAH
jgi:hypothetical protein